MGSELLGVNDNLSMKIVPFGKPPNRFSSVTSVTEMAGYKINRYCSVVEVESEISVLWAGKREVE